MDQKQAAVMFLMGPTACGKTDLAVELVRRFPFEIVSVDSAMVYRGMDIGTAKPDAETLRLAPHRLIDVCDPAEAYSAARFREDALREIAAVHAAGRILIKAHLDVIIAVSIQPCRAYPQSFYKFSGGARF